jgi:acyl-CoA synthetase (NDP forming)
MDLSRLLRPRSIAVIGGREAAEVVRQCDRLGYAGTIWPVHPSKAEVEGRPCVRSVNELPATPDAAFIAVNREQTVEVAGALARHGAGGAVAYASGFSETGGRGRELQAALVAAAGAMPVVGPNCYGLINYLDGALLWPDQHGGRRTGRGVALVTQSGNMAINFTMQRRGLPLAYVISVGNQAMVGLSTCIAALADDPRVSAIGLHIEGFDDIAAFDAAVRTARVAGKPVVALKTGRSETGARIALSHTASLAGADAVVDAYFARAGIARVRSVTAFLETLKLLHVFGPLPGRAIVSMSCSGGEASLMADTVADRDLRFHPFDADDEARIRATLSELVTVSNPLDYHTFIWAKRDELEATFAAVLESGPDLALLLLDYPRPGACADHDWQITTEALTAAQRTTGIRAAVLATLPECMPEDVADALAAGGTAPMVGIDDTLIAIEAAASIGEAWSRAAPDALSSPAGVTGPPALWSEWEAKQGLARCGLAVPEARLAADVEEAVRAATELGFPVALKAVVTGLAHKSEAGAVRLGIAGEAEARAAAAALLALGDQVLVERMVEDPVAELIVGVGRDPLFGLHLVVGSGGVLVELAADGRTLLMPTDAAEVERAIAGLKAATLIEGFRGRPPGDLAAAVEAVLAVQRFALAHADRLVELDVNPLLVRPEGRGAVAVDALVRMAAAPAMAEAVA